MGHQLQKLQREVKPLWAPETQTNSWGSVDAMQKAVEHIRKIGLKPKRIAAEFGFLPYDASQVLRPPFPIRHWSKHFSVLDGHASKNQRKDLHW